MEKSRLTWNTQVLRTVLIGPEDGLKSGEEWRIMGNSGKNRLSGRWHLAGRSASADKSRTSGGTRQRCGPQVSHGAAQRNSLAVEADQGM